MRVAVVGAGVTGLVAARRCREAGADVLVLDAGPPGGLAGGFSFPGAPGVWLEKYYHHIFRSDQQVVKLIDEMGLGDELKWRTSKAGLWAQGKVWPFAGPMDLLKFKPLGSFLERLKMGFSMRVFQKSHDWRPFDDHSCETFFKRRNNTVGYKGLWEPLLKTKFGAHFANIPATFLWGRIYPRSRSREKGKESLGYLTGGFARFIIKLVDKLKTQGVKFEFDAKVTKIARTANGGFTITRTNAAGQSFNETVDRIIWTGNPQILARVLEGDEPVLRKHAEEIRYIGAACLVLIMKKPLGPFYWINTLDPDISFGGVIEHTNLVPAAEYNGKNVAYIINYLDPKHPYLKMTADELFQTHLASLRKMYPDFNESDIEQKLVFQSTSASPLYDIGFGQRVPPFTGSSPGIGLLGMPQVYPVDRNMNHCIEVALAADIDTFLSESNVTKMTTATPASAAVAA